ncbi:MAG: metallophosphoesterase [Bacteroidaceae bacterium]|nr:metallophosphoesterase [Bacteroidaceae bacterium]
MKRQHLAVSLLLAWATAIPTVAQHRADQQHLTDPQAFTFIMMGDPQNYVKYTINQPLYELTTVWAKDNVENLNVKAVLITGDNVNHNEWLPMKRDKTGNQSSKQMWEWTSHCLERLDNIVPYVVSSGNHDYGYMRGDEPFTHYPEYITMERNSKNMECIVAAFPNKEGHVSIENAAYEFSDPNWGSLLIINTEWAPRDEVLEWAKKLCESDKYKNHKVIIQTHSFLAGGKDPRRTTMVGTRYKIQHANQGQEMWDKLIYPCKNIRLVLCGHAGKNGEVLQDNTSYRVDKNADGKKVHQMMFNNQFIGGGGYGNGGDGWVRILEFMPDGKTIKIRTYSPLFGISPMTKQYAHRTSEIDQFDIKIKDWNK